VPYAARWVRTFGATSGAGRLGDIEAVQVDYAHQRLLIADEEQQNVKVYTLAGRFTGQTMGETSFRHEPEGIALYPCGDAGYWVVTDQSDEATVYRVFDRATLKEAGAFTGQKTRESDGIAILGADPGGASSGTFFAVYGGRAVAAIAWEDIARGLGLRCGQ
jgi:3-phytase